MFAAIGAIFSFLWGGIQAAVVAAVEFLEWAVTALWAYAISVYNGLIALTGKVLSAFRRAWDFLRSTYDDVLKPAWSQFWKLIDRVRGILTDVFGPVLRLLYRIREYIIGFYDKWIRPVLDAIDAMRSILRVLETLHIKFAAELDAWLGKVETAIDKPFQYVLAKLNEVINVVNRAITANGLFQRLALIRSIQRDVQLIGRALINPLFGSPSEKQNVRLANAWKPQPVASIHDELGAYLRGESNDTGDVIDAVVATGVDYWTTGGSSNTA